MRRAVTTLGERELPVARVLKTVFSMTLTSAGAPPVSAHPSVGVLTDEAAPPPANGEIAAHASASSRPAISETVEYLCVASEHAPRSLARGTGLSWNRDGWAYCPAGAAQNHRWFATGGIEIEGLTRYAVRDSASGDGGDARA